MPGIEPHSYLPREAAFKSIGERVPLLLSAETPKECSLCLGRLLDNNVVPTKNFFSHNFTEWDRIVNVSSPSPHICSSCAWFFSEKNLRTKNIYIREKEVNETVVEFVSLASLTNILNKELVEKECVTLPFSGRKHLLPYTQWSQVSTDNGNIVWGRKESSMFSDVLFLRDMGFPVSVLMGEKSLHNVSFAENQYASMQKILEVWQSLGVWKKTLAYKIACHVAKANVHIQETENSSMNGTKGAAV